MLELFEVYKKQVICGLVLVCSLVVLGVFVRITGINFVVTGLNMFQTWFK